MLPVLGIWHFFWAAIQWVYTAAIVSAAAYGIGRILAPKPKDVRAAATLDDLRFPTAQEGRSLPVIFGTPKRIKGPNVIWYGDYDYENKRDNGALVAVMYYVGVHYGICHAGVDGVKQIWYGEKCVWPTVNDETVFAADATAQATVLASTVYGGWSREGGAMGYVDLCYGASDQSKNSYLEAQLGADIPAFRGMVTAVCNRLGGSRTTGFYWGTSPYPKILSFIVKANQKLTDGSAQWYLAKAAINTYDLNPAHIIRQCLTDTLWGERRSTDLIGDTFTTVADTLYDETFGLSFAYVPEPGNLQDFVDMVLDHIDGVLYQDRSTGTYELALVREDYTVADLQPFDETDFTIEQFGKAAWGDVPGRVVLKYSDRLYPDAVRLATYEDIAIIEKQGDRVNEVVLERPGIYDEDLANTVVAREGRQLCSRPARLRLKGKRTMSHLNAADVFTLSYDDPDLPITEMVCRVQSMKLGKVDDEYVTIECIEDVFASGLTIYGTPATGWTRPSEHFLGSTSASPSSSPSASISSSPSMSLSASVSMSPSTSISSSPSTSISASPSTSPSISVSGSPSASVSSSVSTSPSASISSSPSASVSSSPSTSISSSPSTSISVSPSTSVSASISASPSTSVSASISASPSTSVSASISASPSTSVSASPSSSAS